MNNEHKFSSLFTKIDELLKQNERVVCAIDGGCASGKTTLAASLKEKYGCNVFSMDDFFLRPFQRTAERLAAPGGNVDYERFYDEVLTPLLAGESFSYSPYDCSCQELGVPVAASPNKLNIIEGAYSLHPYLAENYNLKVFLNIKASEQKDRLIKRNKELYPRFEEEWIPLENKYFDKFKPYRGCDMIFEI